MIRPLPVGVPSDVDQQRNKQQWRVQLLSVSILSEAKGEAIYSRLLAGPSPVSARQGGTDGTTPYVRHGRRSFVFAWLWGLLGMT